jgi:SAM-dependent methyltransferase
VDGGPPGQDREILREQAYADDSLLDVRRRTHELYTVDPVDFGRWTLEQMSWRGDERVLDVGCGPGDMLQAMARRHHDWGLLAGLDLSTGMVATAAGAAQGLGIQHFVGDGQALPLPGGSFDVVMARHMLYHVPDIDRALAQVARVLRPGGRFLATTNSRHTMAEYHALREQAAASFPAMAHSEMITDRFSLENGPSFLQPYFDQVEVHTLPGILRFPNTQPFVDYFESSRALTMRPGHTDAEWQAVLDFVRAEVEAVIRRRGHFDVTKLTGALVGIRRD